MATMKDKIHRMYSKKNAFPFIYCIIWACLFFFFVTPAYGMNVTLQWDANTEPNLAGYKIYYDTDSGVPYNPAVEDRATNNPDGPPIVLGSDATEITLAGLTDGKVYYFAITAFDDQGQESGYSNEVTTDDSPPAKVTNLSSSPDKETWSNDNTVTVSWTAADDGALGSGVDGYSIVWDTNPTTVPDTSKDIGAVISERWMGQDTGERPNTGAHFIYRQAPLPF
jgi:hypothetical protein